MTKSSVFVIMPFDTGFQGVYDGIIQAAFKDSYEVIRADTIENSRNILKDVIRGIINAKLIVADITGLNPNVMYELGICHGLKIPTLILTQSIDEIPFDLRSYRAFQYPTYFDKVPAFIDKMRDLGNEHLKGNLSFENPVHDFGQTKFEPDHADIKSSGEVEDADEPGFIEFIVDEGKTLDEAGEVVVRVGKLLENLGERQNERNNRIEQAKIQGGANLPLKLSVIADESAKDIANYSVDLNNECKQLLSKTSYYFQALSNTLEMSSLSNPDEIDSAIHLRTSLEGIILSAEDGNNGMRSFNESVGGVSKISKSMSNASKKVIIAQENYVNIVDGIIASSNRIINIINQKLGVE